ncbi:MAG: hypothetical protein EOM66_00715 [Clostridia bacterium]|nr:hypothetical protein [Clostridia bacterium]
MRFNKGIRLLALTLALICLPWGTAMADLDATPEGTAGASPTTGATPETLAPTPGEADPTPGEASPTPGEASPTPGEATPSPAAPSLTPGPVTPAPSTSPATTPTPAATPTPPITPSPTPIPTHAVSFQGQSLELVLGESINLLSGITAKDENGANITVTLVDDGGFDSHVVGSYTLRYKAIHPITGQSYSFSRTITVYKSSEQEKYKITIVAGELVFSVGASKHDLLKDAKAVDENGKAVELGVYSQGGFSISSPGTYTVVLVAQHPKTGELFKQSRTVRVLSEEDYKAWQKAQRRLSGDSNERYAKYLKYRNEIYEKLKTQMDELTAQMNQRIQMLSSAFGDKTIQLVRYTPALLDDSDAEGSEETTLSAKHFPVGDAGYSPMQTISISNWSDILAVFVAKSSLDVAEPLDLMNLRKIEYDGLGQVFWDMNELTYHVDGDFLRVMITPRAAEEMAAHYNWTEERQLSLEELLQPEFLKVFASLTGDTSFDDMSAEDEEAIRASLPKGLDVQRESIVMTACSLVDKVSYFWGGKYNEVGWNPLWGIPKRVSSEGSKTTGKVRNYGLDCSGFVTWTFINAAGDPSVAAAIGEGSANQWAKSKSLGWDEAEPGDLAFLAKPGSVEINHVGIVAYKTEDGQYMIVHSSSKANGVVVTEAVSSGFRYFRRPALYLDGEEAQ